MPPEPYNPGCCVAVSDCNTSAGDLQHILAHQSSIEQIITEPAVERLYLWMLLCWPNAPQRTLEVIVSQQVA